MVIVRQAKNTTGMWLLNVLPVFEVYFLESEVDEAVAVCLKAFPDRALTRVLCF